MSNIEYYDIQYAAERTINVYLLFGKKSQFSNLFPKMRCNPITTFGDTIWQFCQNNTPAKNSSVSSIYF